MQKRFKTVSMMLFLLGTFTGAAYASPSTMDVDDVRNTQQTAACTGTVKDATGEPVIGASVVIKGTTTGTITDFDGKFSLPDANRGNIIQISNLDLKFLRLPLDEPLFEIDANSRKINVDATPFKTNGLSVQGDNLAETIFFKITR